MSSNWTKPIDLDFPLTAKGLEEINSMFQKLFSKFPLGVNRGGTGLGFGDDFEVGDLLFIDLDDLDDPTFALLPSVSAGSYLRSGGIATAPLWSTLKLPNTAAVGDILIASTLDTITGLAIGASGTVVRSNGTIPANSAFTIANTFSAGQIVYASALDTLTGLATATTGKFVRWSGTLPTWSTLTIPNVAAAGGLFIATFTDTMGLLAIAPAGQILRSGGSLPAYTAFTIPNTFALGDIIYGSATNVLTALAGNITTTQKFLSQTGTGTVSAAPSWQLVPSVGSLVFFFKNTASSIGGGYLEMSTPASVGAAQTIVSGTLTTGTTTLANFATVAGVPNVTFVPAGVCTCYITAKVDAVAGSKTVQLVAEFYQRTSGGTETLMATSAQTINLTTLDAAYIFQGAIPSSLVFVATDRLVTRVRGVVTGAGNDVIVTLTIEGTTAARSESPSATVDATNFVPYSGATANLDLGSKTLTTTGALTAATVTTTTGAITSATHVIAAATSAHFWTGRTILYSPANGQVNILNNAETAGVGIDIATDAVLKIRTRAQSAYATVDALGYQASGVAGVSFGPGAVTSITVVNGIVTAIS